MALKQLKDIQNLIQNSIQKKSTSIELESVILKKPPLSTTERLAIYQKAYSIRMSESLADDFEILKSQMAEDEFKTLIQNYILENPSTVRNLAEYSQKFPQHILQYAPTYFEFALKDWMLIESNQALDQENSVSLEEIQTGQTFELQRHPACRIESFNSQFFMSSRLQEESHVNSITAKEFIILDFLKNQKSLESLEQFSKKNDIDETALQGLISNWISKKIILLQRRP